MKGEERVCHVTEADTPGPRTVIRGWMCPKKCLHGRPLGAGGVLPLCAAVMNIKRNEKGIWWMPWH